MRSGSKTPPAEAAPPLLLGRKARFLRLVRGRLAANYGSMSTHLHTESPHLHSQQQTLPHSESGGTGVRGRALSGGSRAERKERPGSNSRQLHQRA